MPQGKAERHEQRDIQPELCLTVKNREQPKCHKGGGWSHCNLFALLCEFIKMKEQP